MGLFSPSKSELAERIDELEDDLDEAVDDAETAERRATSAMNEADRVQRNLDEHIAEVQNALAPQYERADEFDFQARQQQDTVTTIEDGFKRGYKKTAGGYVVELVLPRGARVVKPDYGNKWRTDEAIVVAIHDYTIQKSALSTFNDDVKLETAAEITDESRHDSSFEYRIGEIVTPDDGLDTNTDTSCSDGVHFFAEKLDAAQW